MGKEIKAKVTKIDSKVITGMIPMFGVRKNAEHKERDSIETVREGA